MIDDRVAVHIKHSSKRIPSWLFTFNDDNVVELERLSKPGVSVWLVLVCGTDGLIAVSFNEFRAINPVWAKATSFVRVDRNRRTMYRVFGTNGKLPAAKPRGISSVIADLRSRTGT
jgi:hypothetical protein